MPADQARIAELMKLAGEARQAGEAERALELFTAAAAAVPPSRPWPHVARANLLRDIGRLDEAEAGYQAVLEAVPGEAQALLGLGHIARQRGETERALELFTAAVAVVPPSNIWPHMARANLLRDIGRLDEAASAYQAVVNVVPGQTQALLGLGHIARKRGESERALNLFTAAIAAAPPGNIWPQIAKANLLRDIGRLDAAASAYQAVLDAVPGEIQALLGLGHIARQRGEYEASLAWYRAATATAPSELWPRVACIDILRELGRHDEARAACDPLLEHRTFRPHALLALGRIERADRHHESALGHFSDAHECDPSLSGPLLEMARSLLELGRPEEALARIEQARTLDPENSRIAMALGSFYAQQQDDEAALVAYREAQEKSDSTEWAGIGAAQALANLGRADEALAMLDSLERSGKGGAGAIEARLHLLERLGHIPEALAQARLATKAWPRHFSVWHRRVQIERLTAGETDMQALLQAAPAASEAHRAQLAILRAQDALERFDLDDAERHLGDAIARPGRTSHALWERARIRLLKGDIAGTREDLAAHALETRGSAFLRGGSPNVSQSHLGQLLDDAALDTLVLTELGKLRSLPPHARIQPLLGIVRAYPDNTIAAIQLLIALRRARLLVGPPETRLHSDIPTRIVQFWDTLEPPQDIACYMRTWRDLHPDYTIDQFSDISARDFLGTDRDVHAAYLRSAELAQRADLFRLAYLHEVGGIYADADDRCLAPLTSVTPGRARLVLYQEDYGTVGNNLILAAPTHPVISLALTEATAAINRGDRDLLWLSTGPGLLTRALARTLASADTDWRDVLADIAVLPRTMIHRAVSMHCLAGYKRSARHWSMANFALRRPRQS